MQIEDVYCLENFSAIFVFNPRMSKRERVDAPFRFFFDCFKTIYCYLMPSLVAVYLTSRHVLVKFDNSRLLW